MSAGPTSRNNAPTTRGRPFGPGNPGRPHGARHKATLAIEALLEGEAEGLTRRAIEAALGGDMTAMRLCLERLLPPRKDRPALFEVGELEGPADALEVLARVIEATGRGELTPADATAVAGLIEAYRRAHETTLIEARITELERRT